MKNRNGKFKNVYERAIKKSKFNFVVEYPIWVSIKRTLTGKLAVDGQKINYFVRLEENVQKPSKIAKL